MRVVPPPVVLSWLTRAIQMCGGDNHLAQRTISIVWQSRRSPVTLTAAAVPFSPNPVSTYSLLFFLRCCTVTVAGFFKHLTERLLAAVISVLHVQPHPVLPCNAPLWLICSPSAPTAASHYQSVFVYSCCVVFVRKKLFFIQNSGAFSLSRGRYFLQELFGDQRRAKGRTNIGLKHDFKWMRILLHVCWICKLKTIHQKVCFINFRRW